jgi:hypothetical protein
MASLTNNAISDTYTGLLKFTDNLGVTGTPKDITDGNGAGLPMAVASDRINFTDTIDFTNATVLGIGGGGAAGLVAGSGSDSMKSADSLTTTPSAANGNTSIAIGNGAATAGEYDVALGDRINIQSGGENTGIGTNHTINGYTNTTIGGNIQISGDNSFIVGTNTFTGNSIDSLVSMGSNNNYGSNVRNTNVFGVNNNFGDNVENSAIFGDFITLPTGTRNYFSFGADSPTGGDPSNSVVIGTGSTVSTNDAIAIGSNISATRSNFLTTSELELQADGGGIIFNSPNGTEYKLTVNDSGDLVVTAV